MSELTRHLFQPYIDLSESVEGPLHAHNPSLAYELFLHPEHNSPSYLLPTRVLPPAFRDNLIEQAGWTEYEGLSPVSVPRHLRSERWQSLCDQVEAFDRLAEVQQLVTANLLFSLGYYELTSTLLMPYSRCAPQCTANQATLSYMATFSRYMLYIGRPKDYDIEDTVLLAQRAPRGSKAKFSACLRLLVFFARDARNLETIAHWRAETERALQELPTHPGSCAHLILWSRFWRAASFLPYFRGDMTQAQEEMDQVLTLGRQAVPGNHRETVVWKTNLVPALQTAAKVALAAGDRDRALRLCEERRRLDPWDSLCLIELGDSLRMHERLEEAAAVYCLAARLGPPGTPVAWYLAGACYERLNSGSLARDCYIRALRIDPLGIPSQERLMALTDCPPIRPFRIWDQVQALSTPLVRKGGEPCFTN